MCYGKGGNELAFDMPFLIDSFFLVKECLREGTLTFLHEYWSRFSLQHEKLNQMNQQ